MAEKEEWLTVDQFVLPDDRNEAAHAKATASHRYNNVGRAPSVDATSNIATLEVSTTDPNAYRIRVDSELCYVNPTNANYAEMRWTEASIKEYSKSGYITVRDGQQITVEGEKPYVQPGEGAAGAQLEMYMKGIDMALAAPTEPTLVRTYKYYMEPVRHLWLVSGAQGKLASLVMTENEQTLEQGATYRMRGDKLEKSVPVGYRANSSLFPWGDGIPEKAEAFFRGLAAGEKIAERSNALQEQAERAESQWARRVEKANRTGTQVLG